MKRKKTFLSFYDFWLETENFLFFENKRKYSQKNNFVIRNRFLCTIIVLREAKWSKNIHASRRELDGVGIFCDLFSRSHLFNSFRVFLSFHKLINFTRWLYVIIVFIWISFKSFVKISRKLIDFSMCGGFVSLLCCVFFSCLFHFIKVSHRSRYRNEKERRKYRGSETRTKNILKGFSPKSKVWKLISTCTRAVCTSSVMAKVDTKSVGAIPIDLFHRNINLRIEEKFHCGKIEFSLIFRLFTQFTFTWQTISLRLRH